MFADSRHVVFFQHGVMDTSLGWVANGIAGSQAFAAFDNGADVWLGSSRSNPPHLHVNKDSSQRGQYWHFSINELGMEDVAAQIDWIHRVKCAELSSGLRGSAISAGVVGGAVDMGRESARETIMNSFSEEVRNPRVLHKRSGSDSALSAAHQTSLAAEAISPSPAPNEGRMREHNLDAGRFPRNKKLKSSTNSISTVRRVLSKLKVRATGSSSKHGNSIVHRSLNGDDDDLRSMQHDRSNPSSSLRYDDTKKEFSEDEMKEKALYGEANVPLRIRRSQTLVASHPLVSDPRSNMTVLNGGIGCMTYGTRTHRPRQGNDSADGLSDNADDNNYKGLPLDRASHSLEVEDGRRYQRLRHRLPVLWASGPSSSIDGSEGKSSSLEMSSPPPDPRVSSSMEMEALMAPDRMSLGGLERRRTLVEPVSGDLSIGSNGAWHVRGTRDGRGLDLETSSSSDIEGLLDASRPHAQPEELQKSETTAALSYHLSQSGNRDSEPYRLQAVGHSLGAASLLVYAVMCGLLGRSHRLSRLVLLTPAGFHRTPPKVAWPFLYAVPALVKLLRWIRPGMVSSGNDSHSANIFMAYKLCITYLHVIHIRFLFVFFFCFCVCLESIQMYVVATIKHEILILICCCGQGTAARIPSPLLRYVMFKLTVDLHQIPALNELSRAALRLLLNGDASEWDRALQMPHYNEASMPAISLHTGDHIMQLIKRHKFLLYDYGSAEANIRQYGQPEPLDVAEHYRVLKGLPVDLVAGRSDGVVAAEDVIMHYEAMQKAGLEVSYKEMDLGHLDLTFAVKNEVQMYLLRRLGLDGNPFSIIR